MLFPRRFEKNRAEFFTGAPACLDGMAVRAEGDHLGRMVRAAKGQVVYVINLQNRFAPNGEVLDVAGAARVLAASSTAKKDSATRSLRAGEIERGSLGSHCVAVPPEDIGPGAEALLSRGQRRERRFGGAGVGGSEQAQLGEQLRRVSVQEIRVHEDAYRRDRASGESRTKLCTGSTSPPRGWCSSTQCCGIELLCADGTVSGIASSFHRSAPCNAATG